MDAGPIRLLIVGPPRTKKNSMRPMRMGRRTVWRQSEALEAWETAAVLQLQAQARRLPSDLPVVMLPYFCGPVNLRARIYRDRDVGDLGNYLAAVCDALEAASIVANDRLIQGFDGSRLDIDRKQPRVEIVLEPLAAVGLPVAGSTQ